MITASGLEDLNREAAERSAKQHQLPFLVEQFDIDLWKSQIAAGKAPRLPFPNLGDRTPRGWKKLGDHFVDATGFNLHDSGGPALSIAAFVDLLEAGHGYALHSAYQFQTYVAEYLPPKARR